MCGLSCWMRLNSVRCRRSFRLTKWKSWPVMERVQMQIKSSCLFKFHSQLTHDCSSLFSSLVKQNLWYTWYSWVKYDRGFKLIDLIYELAWTMYICGILGANAIHNVQFLCFISLWWQGCWKSLIKWWKSFWFVSKFLC